MTALRDEILEALHDIPEPCSIAMRAPMDIREMGLVESVEVEGTHVDIVLVLTDPSCVHFVSMQRFIADRLTALDGVETVAVGMSTSQLWTSDRVRRRTPADA